MYQEIWYTGQWGNGEMESGVTCERNQIGT